MSAAVQPYPKSVAIAGNDIVIRPVTRGDVDAVQEFVGALPEHDLLFMARDLTHPKVVEAWLRATDDGAIDSLIAEVDGRIVAGSALVRDPLGWSRHVGEIRLLVSESVRGKGVGGAVLFEVFRIATKLGLSKLVARMTPDQTAAIALFMGMGFRGEAMLKDHVMDRRGNLFDLAILSHDIGKVQSRMEAYGLPSTR